MDSAADAAQKYMKEQFFNPAAAYSPAVESERAVNAARTRLATLLGAQPAEIIYTSGGTESNNTAILGALRARRGEGRVIVGAVEHPSVYEAAHSLLKGYEVVDAPVLGDGAYDTDALKALLDGDVAFVSLMQVNNETGAINDSSAIERIIRRSAPSAVYHVDGVQGFMKVPFSAKNCDMYSVSAHKLHAPKGVGALYVKSGVRFAGGLTGGGQESNRRSGTTNTPGIMGLDAALGQYSDNLEDYRSGMMRCKLRLCENLLSIPDAVVNGPKPEDGAPHILNVSFMGVRGEVLLHALESRGVYVSTGSACSAKKKGKNRILSAMGIVGERQEGAIRFSLCPFNTPEEMDEAAEIIKQQTAILRRYKRR